MIVRVRGIKIVRTKRGAGVYCYHRKSGKLIVGADGTPLQPSSPQFIDKVRELDGRPAKDVPQNDGRLGSLIHAYRASPEFTGLADRTKADYQRVFDHLQTLVDRRNITLIEFNRSTFILQLRDKAFSAHKRRFANYVVQVVSVLLGWGKPREWVTHNAADDVELIRRPRGMARANRPWTAQEREAVMKAAPAHLARPIALGMHAGQRQQDVLAFPKSGYRDGKVRWIAKKNGREIWLPAHPELRKHLEAAPKAATIFCLNSYGRMWTQAGFRASFFKLIGNLEAEKKVGPGLTFHGLRHTLGDSLAEIPGIDTRDIADVLGITEQMAKHYSAGADRHRRAAAAITKLHRRFPKRP